MREQNIHEKVVNIDNQKKKKLFFGVGRLERFALESRERIPVLLVRQIIHTRCGSYQMW